ncbi:MAG: hypothetical protein AAGF12_11095 [Myxococcota bacterium]
MIRAWGVLLVLAFALPTMAGAQEMSDEERAAAAEAAYDRGARAFRSGEFAEAGRWWERADSFLPANAALVQATVAYQRAGDVRRAATVAETLLARDRGALDDKAFVEEAARERVRVRIMCATPCDLSVNGVEERHRILYLTPELEYRVEASFDEGLTERMVSGRAQTELAIRFEAPPSESGSDIAGGPIDGPAPAEPSGGLPLPVVLAAGGATVVAGAVTLWSGLDARSAKSDFDANPTLTGFDDGRSKETRTNILIGVTAGLLVVTGVLAIFTDWGGGTEGEELQMGVAPIAGGAVASLGGALP